MEPLTSQVLKEELSIMVVQLKVLKKEEKELEDKLKSVSMKIRDLSGHGHKIDKMQSLIEQAEWREYVEGLSPIIWQDPNIACKRYVKSITNVSIVALNPTRKGSRELYNLNTKRGMPYSVDIDATIEAYKKHNGKK